MLDKSSYFSHDLFAFFFANSEIMVGEIPALLRAPSTGHPDAAGRQVYLHDGDDDVRAAAAAATVKLAPKGDEVPRCQRWTSCGSNDGYPLA